MSLLVTGTIGIDTVLTPHGDAPEILGGSAVYFAFAAAMFTDVRLVAVVGDDFPAGFLDLLASHTRIDLTGLERRAGSRTFRWTGKYAENMNHRDTLETQLNVVAEAPPIVPDAFADSEVVFLANTHPALQRGLLSQVSNPRLSVCDTMDLWINTEQDELRATLAAVDGVIINDSEVQMLTGESNTVVAGKNLLQLGPAFVVVKKGEHGAMLFCDGEVVSLPAFPAERVVDPTGAGDSFAGGMLGYLDTVPHADNVELRRALVRGMVAASFTIEDFSLNRLRSVNKEQLAQRIEDYSAMLRVD